MRPQVGASAGGVFRTGERIEGREMTVVGTGAKRVRCSAGWVTGAHPSTRSLAAALEDKQPRWLTGFACCAVTDKKGKVHMEPVQRWLVRGKPERAVKNSKHHRIAREGKLRWECVRLLSLSSRLYGGNLRRV